MRVVIAEDSVLLREGLVRLLMDSGFDVVGQAGDAEALLDLIGRHGADVAVVDIRMPPSHTDEGLVAALAIRTEWPQVGVLVLSEHIETHYAVQLLEGGADGVGYLLKNRVADIEDFAEAVRRVGNGGSVIDPQVVARLVGRRRVHNPLDELTIREREVLALMAEGRSNQAIGDRTYLSPRTVEAHIRSIFMKLELGEAPADNRRVLAVLAYLRQ